MLLTMLRQFSETTTTVTRTTPATDPGIGNDIFFVGEGFCKIKFRCDGIEILDGFLIRS